ncbi:MAG: gliding motility-associated C-terminal domain-containing protein [Bacteroidetes bacterium]|nr:gliding motility-associated C-terminal domain-containing protein [Bacteroidota bacterium]
MLIAKPSPAQPGFGQPIYKQDFGTGNVNPSTIGTPIPASKTAFPFDNNICPAAGSYTILRRVPVANCFNGEWIDLSHDANTAVDYGMMMLVNNNFNAANRLVYRDTINKTLCPGEVYWFSAAIINLDLIDGPAMCVNGPDYPIFELRIEDDLGNLIKKDTTPVIVSYAAPPLMGYRFGEYGINFSVPPGVNRLVAKLTLLAKFYGCAEDFAVDDIQIRARGPEARIQFAGEPTTFVKSVCFQNNPLVSLTGVMDPYYANPSLQWQQSTDGGTTWTDIPSATGNTYTNTYSTPDTFLIRLSGGDASTIANPNCRVVSNSLRLEVDGLPTGYTISTNSPVCAGEDLQFTGAGAASYIWTGPNGFYDNIATPHIFHASLQDSGMYYVEVFSLGGCRKTDSVRAIVIGTDVHAGPDTAICKGETVRLTTSTGVSYAWTPAAGLSNTNQVMVRAAPDKTTEYIVKVTDSFGCSDTAHVTVTVKNTVAVKAVIEANAYLCRMVDSLHFTSKSQGAIDYWKWDFGNGQISLEEKPPVQYYSIAPSQYDAVARLIVRDTSGCADTAFHFMKVEDNCYIAVPTAFTPDNDGMNDHLYPLNAFKARDLLFRVYNRYGQLVFTSRDHSQKWDGRINGVDQNTGVYVWMLDYTDVSGRRISLKGTSVLIRK